MAICNSVKTLKTIYDSLGASCSILTMNGHIIIQLEESMTSQDLRSFRDKYLGLKVLRPPNP